jgi:purine-binding chemotaxis protein CheW
MENLTSKVDSFLTFRLNNEIFAAGVDKVLEILEIPKITHVPRSPDYMRGVINLRGNVLPVIDTRSKFGLEPTADTINTCIIVMNLAIDDQQISIGAVVDAVQEVMEISDNDIQPAPSVGSRYKAEFIQGMVKYNDQFIMKLDVDKVFSSDEANILQTVSETNP